MGKHSGVFLRVLAVLLVLLAFAWMLVTVGSCTAIEPSKPINMPQGLPWGTVMGTNVNFRTGPGTQYPSLFQWSTGHGVEIIREVDGWYEVHCWITDHPAWVNAEYIKVHQ